jgi:DMSO reductase anchor subunit
MHPAYSIIFFTTASGLGYGLLILLGLAGAAGYVPPSPWLGVVGLGLALGAVTFGLLSSTFHLGHPERAWMAVREWRSSWLAREGVLALATYVPAGLFGVGWVFLSDTSGIWAVFGALAALGAAVTVACTAMIYASIRAIPRWHNAFVPPVYLALGLMTGAFALDAILRVFGEARPAVAVVAIAAAVVGAGLKLLYWRHIDGAPPVATAASATGLSGTVRLLEGPHTSPNYLQQEMGYRVARKHAVKLRSIALVLGFAAPVALSLLALLSGGWTAAGLAVIAALLAYVGVLIERWLFFAEAQHAVMLYYGEATV